VRLLRHMGPAPSGVNSGVELAHAAAPASRVARQFASVSEPYHAHTSG